jgi:hypothetical protein
VPDGNPNEIYAAFIPLCLLLIGLAARGVRSALLFLPVVLLTMLSDGKTNSLMALFYVGLVCGLEWLVPGADRANARAVKYFLVAMAITALLGMARILPCLDLLHSHVGAVHLLPSHPKTYQPPGVKAYSAQRLCRQLVGWRGRTITKRGSAVVRQYLFPAALRLIKADPRVAAWYRLRAGYRGGNKLVAVIAVMRKLIRALWHVACGNDFDSSKLIDQGALPVLHGTALAPPTLYDAPACTS